MELDIKPRVQAKEKIRDIDGGHSMNLYNQVPFGQLTLEECEDLFRQRIEALCIIEKSDLVDKNVPIILHSLRNIKSFVYRANCIVLNRNDPNQRRQDQFSHMLLRMYCVDQSNLWPWFKQQEKRLFLLRLKDQASSLSGSQLETMLRSFNFKFERVIGSELSELHRENLIGWSHSNFDRGYADIFKVRFTDALKFVARRTVSLKDGYAFLTKHEIISVVSDAFEKHLESELSYARQHLDRGVLQARQLLDSLNIVYQDHEDRMADEKRKARQDRADDAKQPFAIDIENLEHLVKEHYPPCMRYLHETLLTDHHLKHQGRLYYGAFLRSGQVDLDTAIEFWRKEFTKKIANDKFERDYKYNIRHLYGKEGQKKALTCFSCDKIIANDPGASEKHGCPFKHFGEPNLISMLSKHGLKEVDINSVIAKRNDKDYKAACTRYFEFAKGQQLSDVVKNPIQFYYESRRLAEYPVETETHMTEQQHSEQLSSLHQSDDPEMEFSD